MDVRFKPKPRELQLEGPGVFLAGYGFKKRNEILTDANAVYFACAEIKPVNLALTRIFHKTTENTKYTKKIKVLSFYSRNFMNSDENIGKYLNFKAFVIFVSFVVKYSG